MKQLEDWLISGCGVRYESGDVIQSPYKSTDLLLSFQREHNLCGFNLLEVDFNASLADNES